MGLRSARWRFSMMVISNVCSSEAWRTMAGIVALPALRRGSPGRSPVMRWGLSWASWGLRGVTRMCWSKTEAAMDWVRSLAGWLVFFAGFPDAVLLFGGGEGFQGAGCGRSRGFAAPFFWACYVVAGEELQGQFAVGLGSAGFRVVEGDGFAVAGGFGQ